MKRALVLLNMGGPNNLNEVKVFLKNMFKDERILPIKSSLLRTLVANLISSLRHKSAYQNYKELGGKSPIADITASLCQRVAKLQEKTQDIKFQAIDFAMRYTPPFASDVLKKYKEYDEIVLFPLYPHHSSTTILSSLDDSQKVINEMNFKGKVKVVKEFYKSNEYNKILISLIKKALNAQDPKDITLLFSAHSLPQSIINKGDLYEKHSIEHTQILKELCQKDGLDFKDYKLAYQSKLGPVKWLEPAMSDTIANINPKRVIVVPISFCIDNSETLFELDVEYKKLADELGYELYKVSRCPNDLDEFASFILAKSDGE